MAVIAKTSRSADYLAWLKTEIGNGGISSWNIDSDGDFCHEAKQVKGKCCFRPEVLDSSLKFNIRWYKGVEKDLELHAELHAHAVRLFMIHGAEVVTSIQITL